MFNIGTKLLIVDAGHGAHGADGKIGIVTSEKSTNGLTEAYNTFNVRIGNSTWTVSCDGNYKVLSVENEFFMDYNKCEWKVVDDKKSLPKELLFELGIENVWFNKEKRTVTVKLKDGRVGTSKASQEDIWDIHSGLFIAYGYAKASNIKSKSKVKKAIDGLYDYQQRQEKKKLITQKEKQLEKEMNKRLNEYRKSL